MNFNTAPMNNTNVNEGKRGRQGDPEIAKYVAQGMPYWKARLMARRNAGGAAPAASVAAAAPSAGSEKLEPSTEGSIDYQKTQAAVDEFLAGNPDASTQQVVDHLVELNDSPVDLKYIYITNPQKIEKMISASKAGGADVEEPSEPSPEDIKSGDDPEVDRLTNLFMKLYSMPKDQRAEYMKKVKAGQKVQKTVEPEVDDEEDGEDVDPYVSQYVKGMKNEPEDTDEEFDEPKED